MSELVRRKINKKEPAPPKTRPVPSGILKLLAAMGKITLPGLRPGSRYTRHQGPRECARRVRQMQRMKAERGGEA